MGRTSRAGSHKRAILEARRWVDITTILITNMAVIRDTINRFHMVIIIMIHTVVDSIPIVACRTITEAITDHVTKCAMVVQVQSQQTVEIVYIMPIIIYLAYVLAIAITMVIDVISFSSELFLKNSAILVVVAVLVWILKIA